MRVRLEFKIWRGFRVKPNNIPQPLSGIYLITCIADDKQYIGQSKNVAERLISHGDTKDTKIGRAIRELGKSSFLAEPIYYHRDGFDPGYLDIVEEALITLYKPQYNGLPGSFRQGNHLSMIWIHNAFGRKRILRGLPVPEGYQLGRGGHGGGRINDTAQANKRATMSMPAYREKQGKNATAYWANEENRRAQSARLTQHIATPEGKATWSEAQKDYQWITNGRYDSRIAKSEPIPIGWRQGRTNYSKPKKEH